MFGKLLLEYCAVFYPCNYSAMHWVNSNLKITCQIKDILLAQTKMSYTPAVLNLYLLQILAYGCNYPSCYFYWVYQKLGVLRVLCDVIMCKSEWSNDKDQNLNCESLALSPLHFIALWDAYKHLYVLISQGNYRLML